MYPGPGTAAGQFLEWNGTFWQPTFAPIGNVNINVQALLGRLRARWISISDGTLGVSIPSGYWSFPASVTTQVPTWGSNWLSIEKIVSNSPGAAGQTLVYRGLGGRGYALSSTNTWTGGWVWVYRGGIHTLLANLKSFFGLYGSVTTPVAVEPSTLLNMVGFGNDSTDANLQLMQNDGAGAATKFDLGANFPANTTSTDFYELTLVALPGQTTSIQWQAIPWFNPTQAQAGTITANLPAANTEMFPYLWMRDEGAGTFRHGLNGVYIQSSI